jgi:hypothetical protein
VPAIDIDNLVRRIVDVLRDQRQVRPFGHRPVLDLRPRGAGWVPALDAYLSGSGQNPLRCLKPGDPLRCGRRTLLTEGSNALAWS